MSAAVAATPILAFAILIGLIFLGDVVSAKTKAFIPAMLIFIIALLLLVWGGVVPPNIIEIPGFTSSYASYIILMFLVDMGTAISLKQFAEQWKTVVICVAAILGIALIVLTLGSQLFGWEYAVAAAPPISGGLVATMEMSNAAIANGNENAARLATMVFAVQNLPAFIILPIFLKKYCKNLLKDKSKLENVSSAKSGITANKERAVDKIPEKYKTTAYYLFQLAILAVMANYTAKFLGGIVSPTVFGLLYGLIGSSLGIVETDCMKKSGSHGFLMFSSLITIFVTLFNTNPSELLAILGPVAVMIGLGIVGIFAGSVLVGKVLKVPMNFSFVLGLNCLLGFPLNYMLTQETIKAVSTNEEESHRLTEKIMPAMLVAGFVSVTIGSTIFASIMKNFI